VLGGAGPFGVALAAHLLDGPGTRVLLADRVPVAAEARAVLDGRARSQEGGATDPDPGAGPGSGPGSGPPAWDAQVGDVTEPAFVDRLLATADALWGGLDGVVLAAGAPAGDEAASLPPERFRFFVTGTEIREV